MQRLYVPSHDMQILTAASKGEWAKVKAGIITVVEIDKSVSHGPLLGMTILLFAARDKQWDIVDSICHAYPFVNVNAQQKAPESSQSNQEPAYAHVNHNALWFALEDKQYISALNLAGKGANLSTIEGISAEALEQYESIKVRAAEIIAETKAQMDISRRNWFKK